MLTGSGRLSPKLLIAVVLVAATLAVYWQTARHEFVLYDDPFYLDDNPPVRAGLSLRGAAWAFKSTYASNWHPLTWLSHMADVSLFGLDAGWHHRVNVLLHAGNAVLLFLVLAGMTGAPWRSALAAALFAVHPLHVESVAWVAERKDLLSTLFLLLSIGAYTRYAARGGVPRYLLAVFLFVLGLLSKPMVVTLPFLLLLLDWWPLRRGTWPGTPPSPSALPWSRLVLEKIPFLALSAASCVITFLAQQSGGAFPSIGYIPLGIRLANAAVSYAAYLAKTVWPSGLAVFYPHPWTMRGGVPAWETAASLLLLAGATAAAFRQAKRRPCLAVGWLWYLGTLVPVIGLVQVGGQAMADRYTYVPLIGIFVALAWAIPDAAGAGRFRRAAPAIAGGAAILALAAVARVQAGYWKDSRTLFGHAIRVTEGNWLAHNNLGLEILHAGGVEEAVLHFREALRIHPGQPNARNNLGLALTRAGRPDEAIPNFIEALRLNPADEKFHVNLGMALEARGRREEAAQHYREALRLKPDTPAAHNNLGAILAETGRLEEAVRHFREALRVRPDYAVARRNMEAAIELMRNPR